MTRNMYIGFDIAADDPAAQFAQFQGTTSSGARFLVLAAEICDTTPDLIGLQEVSTVTVTPGPVVEFLTVLLSLIEDCGTYVPAVVSTGLVLGSIPVAANTYASFKEEDVILVNTDRLKIEASAGGQFKTLSEVVLPDGSTADRPRSWQYVDATLDGHPFRFGNTHLETSAPFFPDNEPVNFAQAEEYIAAAIDTAPEGSGLIIVGDLNSVPSSETIKLFQDKALSDAWDINDGDEGLTCCQDGSLINEVSEITTRLDYIFYRDSSNDDVVFDITSTELVGIDTFQDTQPMYASDHAGVVTSFDLE